MKNKIITAAVFALAAFIFFGCNHQKRIAANYSYKTECLGIELDGSQTLKAWGNGRNYWDAVEQARKNAIRDVLFVGISNGKPDCNVKPIIFEVNAQEKYQDYFNKFFADKGEYMQFVTNQDERIGQKISRDRMKADESRTHGLVVRIKRADLVAKMKADGIIKQ